MQQRGPLVTAPSWGEQAERIKSVWRCEVFRFTDTAREECGVVSAGDRG